MYNKAWDPLYKGIRHFEAGGSPYRPKYDYGPTTWGYGTNVKTHRPPAYGSPDYNNAAEIAMQDQVARVGRGVNRWAKNNGVKLTPGQEMALIDLSYNAGNSWQTAGLGKALKRGDAADARGRYLQYVKAGGQRLPGLARRREWGATELWDQNFQDAEGYGEGAVTARADATGRQPMQSWDQYKMGLGHPASSTQPTTPAPIAGTASPPLPIGTGAQTRQVGTINGGWGVNPLTGSPVTGQEYRLAGPAPAHMVGAGYGREQLPPEGAQSPVAPTSADVGGFSPVRNPLAQEKQYGWGQSPWTEAMHHQMQTGDSSQLDAINEAAPVEGFSNPFKGWF